MYDSANFFELKAISFFSSSLRYDISKTDLIKSLDDLTSLNKEGLKFKSGLEFNLS